jgi:hypothetical protein
MTGVEWVEDGLSAWEDWRRLVAAQLTAQAGSAWVITPALVGWRLRAAPDSSVPSLWGLTLPGLLRRLARAVTSSSRADREA